MTTHEVEEMLDITKKTLIYYENEGLVKPLRDNNNYRCYNQNDVSKGMEPVAPNDRDSGRTDRHSSLFRAVCLTAGGGLTGTRETEREAGRRNP